MWAWFILASLWSGRCLAVGENYVGIGYNLLKANPDGGQASRGGVDPGLLITRHILDLSNHNTIQAERRHSCSTVKSTSMFYGGKSYQDKLSTAVNLGGGVTEGLDSAKFSLSSRFQDAQSETQSQHQVFQDQTTICNLGHVRYKSELASHYHVRLTDNFEAAVCGLNTHYHQSDYMAFLDHWGTHMTTEVDIGTRVIHRSKTSLSQFVRHVMKESGSDVSLGGNYMGYDASLGININSFKSRDAFDEHFGSHSEDLSVGSTSMPEPITVTLVTIDSVVKSRGSCHGHTSTRDAIANNLHRALKEYATYKNAHSPTDPQLKIPLTWPSGTYGLMKPKTGCPSGKVRWHEGYRYEDTRNVVTQNHFSSPLHLAGSWPAHGDIQMEFCMKGDRTLSEFDVDWPAGDYCLLKYGTCPSGFQTGYIQWDDRNVRNHNRVGGTVPDGKFDSNTKIEFCCRDDDMPTKEIFLPISKPFYLLRHTRGCQEIHEMTLREEYVQLDENWHVIVRYSQAGGDHPYDDGHSNRRLHFCYYTPTSHASHLIG